MLLMLNGEVRKHRMWLTGRFRLSQTLVNILLNMNKLIKFRTENLMFADLLIDRKITTVFTLSL